MRIYIAIGILLMASSLLVFAGRPIFLTDAEASTTADLVILADIVTIQDVPDPDPFNPKTGVSESGEPFAKFTTIGKFTILVGSAPETISIYGGKVFGMTGYRLETGRSLLLLKKIGEARYRAVDWSYGLMPIKDGKVEWMLTSLPKNTEWISIEDAVRKIKGHRARIESQR